MTAPPVPATPTAPADPAGSPRAGEKPGAGQRAGVRTLLARLNSPVVRTRLGTLAGLAILAVLMWRLGTGVFLDGLRRIDGPALLAALALGLVTTVFSAWRWSLVSRGLGIRLPLGRAVADYYRALFLNAALPGGVVGDVHRAVHHGRSTGDLGRGVRAVVLERTAGQLALFAAGAAVLLTVPSPVLDEARHAAPLAGLGALGACLVVLALRMNRPTPSRRGRALRRMLAEAREGLLSRSNGPGVLVSSVVVLAGHIAMFVLAARVTGTDAAVSRLLPLAVLALRAMSLPLNVGGWGPREGVTAWAFGAAGLGAGQGLAVAVVYGVLCLVASLPGLVVLAARWYAGLRAGRRTVTEPVVTGPGAQDGTYPRASPRAAVPDVSGPSGTPAPDGASAPPTAPAAPAPGPPAPASPAPAPPVPASPVPVPVAVRAPAVCSPPPVPPPVPPPSVPAPRAVAGPSGPSPVRRVKYAPKESARLARRCLPFSAEPREGRPMTPESV
ncbi:lysylphosphatidylglycerol synthase transmembrane domain-containing protein [Streptomyces sp. NPDC057115]|uniref:lysylphosphatidylglycerol synthase transmembrane domain-containing protein n=1 Tax=Streptomyces sp. NPDC057115 TaxID=3346022 RepID=UPI00362D63EA